MLLGISPEPIFFFFFFFWAGGGGFILSRHLEVISAGEAVEGPASVVRILVNILAERGLLSNWEPGFRLIPHKSHVRNKGNLMIYNGLWLVSCRPGNLLPKNDPDFY